MKQILIDAAIFAIPILVAKAIEYVGVKAFKKIDDNFDTFLDEDCDVSDQ